MVQLPALSQENLESLLIEAEYFNVSSLVEHIKSRKGEGLCLDIGAPTKVVTIVNGWSNYPGISIKTAQQRVQSAIEAEEQNGWSFINSTVETCKSRDAKESVSTVNLVYLFFKRKGGEGI